MLKFTFLIHVVLLHHFSSACDQPEAEVTQDDLLSAVSFFGGKIFESLQDVSPENFIFSPFSIRSTMTMLALTQGKNLDPKFEKLMCFQKNLKADSEVLHDVILSFQGTGVHMANGVFGNNLRNVSDEFVHNIEALNGTVRNIDFHQEEKSMKIMNDFVAHATNDKILGIIKRGDLDSSLPAVFINVLYFKNEWKKRFKPDTDPDRVFYIPGGKTVKPEFMSRKSEIAMLEGEHAIYFDLLYKNPEYSMLVSVPDDIDFLDHTVKSFDYLGLIGNMTPKVIEVVMPKIKIQKEIDFKTIFSKLGIYKIFSKSAVGPWSHIFEGDRTLMHEAYIDINEVGTEAAAVTSTRGTRAKQLSIVVDRPFWFAILKRGKTGIKYPVLMMGKIVNPLG